MAPFTDTDQSLPPPWSLIILFLLLLAPTIHSLCLVFLLQTADGSYFPVLTSYSSRLPSLCSRHPGLLLIPQPHQVHFRAFSLAVPSAKDALFLDVFMTPHPALLPSVGSDVPGAPFVLGLPPFSEPDVILFVSSKGETGLSDVPMSFCKRQSWISTYASLKRWSGALSLISY